MADCCGSVHWYRRLGSSDSTKNMNHIVINMDDRQIFFCGTQEPCQLVAASITGTASGVKIGTNGAADIPS